MEVASRELRNNTADLLRRVDEGEHVTITVNGRPVAELRQIPRRATWTPRDQFLDRLSTTQADTALTAELKALAPDTTDDL